MTYAPMTPAERRVVADALAEQESELRWRRERGPWRDPELEVFMTGRSYPREGRVRRATSRPAAPALVSEKALPS